MTTIEVTFPREISPATVKTILEGNMEKKSKYTCSVEFAGYEDGEAVYNISSQDGAEAFYLIGMTASGIIASFC